MLDILGEFVTNIRAREVIGETLVYTLKPWYTNHYPPWIRPNIPNPNNYRVIPQGIYVINEDNGTVTAGSQAQSNIRLSVSNLYTSVYTLHMQA